MALTRGAALDYLQRRFAGFLRERETEPSIGTAVSVAVPGSSERVSLLVVNLSANTVYLGTSPNVSSTRGIRLAPNGGLISMSIDEDSLLPTLQWYAIATGAASALYVLAIQREVGAPAEG